MSSTHYDPVDTSFSNLSLTAIRLLDHYTPSFLTSQKSPDMAIPSITSDGPAPGNILYLAYGSNLDAGVFQGRRGIKPLSATVVTVPSLTLVFDLPGIAYIEPCFANVRTRKVNAPSEKQPLVAEEGLEDMEATVVLSKLSEGRYRDSEDPNDDVDAPALMGVVYEVTPEDYATIIATEGGGASYADVTVDCISIDGKSLKAHTLLAPTTKTRPNSGAQASARYLNIISSGAEQHGLPESYRSWLARFRPYRVTTLRQRVGCVLFVAMWAPAVMVTFAVSRWCSGSHKSWAIKISESVFGGMWSSYDRLFKPYFGDGERTEGEKEKEVDEEKTALSEPEKTHRVEDMFVTAMGGETNMESSVASLSASWDKL
ncbi:uncharacterized protein LAJ45_08614 [Morchella importuna]|uniref:uncharacterized protein n=1 Tax=Morchella importuna TaxID=1174673 RepID=UPI001E8DB218|nr:uncharacterized protein LAJ45_08614 [Morchella importuna]KAH8147457.1 hypothetical protein LAJ45_08614 [Morchella importuna]